MEDLRVKNSALRQTILDLSRSWNQKRHKEGDDAIIQGLTGESIFFQTVCMSCRRLAECSEEMESLGLRRSSAAGVSQEVWRSTIGSFFNRSVLFSSDHNW